MKEKWGMLLGMAAGAAAAGSAVYLLRRDAGIRLG